MLQLGLTVLMVVLHLGVHAQSTYTNPVLARDFPDPTVSLSLPDTFSHLGLIQLQ